MMTEHEKIADEFLRCVDALIPTVIEGVRVSTDRVIPRLAEHAVILQFWLDDGPDAGSGFVTASSRELRMNAGNIQALAAERVAAALRSIEKSKVAA
jgi:hypothetical protein